MRTFFKRLLRKTVNIFRKTDDPIESARKRGIRIGRNVHIYSQLPLGRDCFLLSIGDNVTVSANVTFLLHDAAIGTMTDYKYTDYLGRVTIGDQCFIGWGAIILPGITLPPRTIVAAGSVVTKSPPTSGLIIGGNPAKVIGSVEAYVQKASSCGAYNLNAMSQSEIERMIEENGNTLRERKTL